MASQEYVTPGEKLRDIRGTFFAGMPGMSPCQKAAFEAFHEPQAMNNDAGLSFDQLKVKLGNRFTPSDLKQAVEDLQNDGHIYTTVDDMHFKGTGA